MGFASSTTLKSPVTVLNSASLGIPVLLIVGIRPTGSGVDA